MSIPLVDLDLSGLTISIFNLYVNSKSNSFYHKDILNIISNNLFNLIFSQDRKMLNEVKVSVNQNNMIYVSKKFLKKVSSQIK